MATKTLVCAAKNKFKLDHALPAYQLEHFNKTVPWGDIFVAEMKRGILACKVM